ncbi:tyrosine-protein phosphatase non-receptor type 2 isoform X8 [Dasypus novemcinctus]|uniref:tyrosine-protein phosphatase non-receptor type 2 isoform X8 n=1 Tax=Dasypus novemcinctus TaxID=9361 RepID=UPI00265E120B|nr:tyrosine-protein phosphatase non-receptor type 2 isoform X8 [Dasypus novemcinctus]
MSVTVELEFEELDAQSRWQQLYLEIRNESHDYPHRVAKFPENRNRNRYRDVSPYDHSRVKLQNTENDYINASLVDIEEAERSYVLTQVKCAQYWPTKDDREMLFKETGFSVKLLSEDVKSYYTVHLLQLENINMEKGDDINIKQVLLNMRKYRMGLIQTPDQLRFSYMAILEGAKFIKGDSNIQKQWKELSKEDLSPAFDLSPPKIITEKYNGNRLVLEEEKLASDRCTGLSSKTQDTVEENSESVLRKRTREDRKANTAQKVQQMKQRLNETERKRKRWLYWQPILTKMGFVSVILVGAFVGWTLFFQQNAL